MNHDFHTGKDSRENFATNYYILFIHNKKYSVATTPSNLKIYNFILENNYMKY